MPRGSAHGWPAGLSAGALAVIGVLGVNTQGTGWPVFVIQALGALLLAGLVAVFWVRQEVIGSATAQLIVHEMLRSAHPCAQCEARERQARGERNGR